MIKTKPKILFVQTNYPSFLKSFFEKYPKWKNYNYEKLIKLRFNEFFGNSDFFSKNLIKLNWKAWDVIVNDSNLQSIWAKEHSLSINSFVDLVLRYIPLSIKTRLGIIDNWMFDTLLAQIKYYKPDIVYFHHLGLFSKKQLEVIKKNTRLLVGQIASPIPKNNDVLKTFDLIITSFPHFLKIFHKMGIRSEYLKWCAEDTILKIIKTTKRIYNVTYVGSFSPYHSKGNSILEETSKNIRINFWGYAENFLPINSQIKRSFKGQAWGKDMYKIFSQSKIIINRHIDISENYANNMRMYEATLMGALLLTDEKDNIDEFFKRDYEVITYKTARDLTQKIKYYLNHKKELNKIAKAGQLRTLKDHTYKTRMKELEKILLKNLNK